LPITTIILFIVLVLLSYLIFIVEPHNEVILNDICIENDFDGWDKEIGYGCFIKTCKTTGELINCKRENFQFDNLRELMLKRGGK
jgi:hypothetical protein